MPRRDWTVAILAKLDPTSLSALDRRGARRSCGVNACRHFGSALVLDVTQSLGAGRSTLEQFSPISWWPPLQMAALPYGFGIMYMRRAGMMRALEKRGMHRISPAL